MVRAPRHMTALHQYMRVQNACRVGGVASAGAGRKPGASLSGGRVSLFRGGEQHPPQPPQPPKPPQPPQPPRPPHPPRGPTLRPLASMRFTNRCVICIAEVALHSWFVVNQGLPDVARHVIDTHVEASFVEFTGIL